MDWRRGVCAFRDSDGDLVEGVGDNKGAQEDAREEVEERAERDADGQGRQRALEEAEQDQRAKEPLCATPTSQKESVWQERGREKKQQTVTMAKYDVNTVSMSVIAARPMSTL